MSIVLQEVESFHLISLLLRYRQDPGHPATLPVDLSHRHVVQRLVLVFTGAEGRVWILLVRGTVKEPLPNIPLKHSRRKKNAGWTRFKKHLSKFKELWSNYITQKSLWRRIKMKTIHLIFLSRYAC